MTVVSTINRTMLPVVINGLGAIEVEARGLTEIDVGALVRRKPVETIGLAMIAGLLLGRLTLGRRAPD